MALTAKKVYAILKRQISDMEAKIKTPIIYRGTVATADLLPLNPDIGDMYNIESKSVYGEAGMNVAWNGVVWDTMGAPIDMSLYIKSSELADWVKQQSKPTYTAEEVGALPADTKIPSKTSDLQNDSGFLTEIPDNYLSGTDKTLSVSGKAADAAAVGNAVVKIESINYAERGTLADTDAFPISDGTELKRTILGELSDFVLDKINDKTFNKLQTNNKTVLGAINELNNTNASDINTVVSDIAKLTFQLQLKDLVDSSDMTHVVVDQIDSPDTVVITSGTYADKKVYI